jgi:hypothetical protein
MLVSIEDIYLSMKQGSFVGLALAGKDIVFVHFSLVLL